MLCAAAVRATERISSEIRGSYELYARLVARIMQHSRPGSIVPTRMSSALLLTWFSFFWSSSLLHFILLCSSHEVDRVG